MLSRDDIKQTLFNVSPAALAFVSSSHYRLRVSLSRWHAIHRPTDPARIDVLQDPLFHTLIDRVAAGSDFETARIAQIFLQCRESPHGAMFDIGTRRGGIALMLAHMHRTRQVYACDTFHGLDGLPRDPELDAHAATAPAWNADADRVRHYLTGTSAIVVEGAFPESICHRTVEGISFAHIDVVLGTSCRAALDYLVKHAVPNARFMVNDFRRSSPGIDRAVHDFLEAHPQWLLCPLYPGQSVLINAARD